MDFTINGLTAVLVASAMLAAFSAWVIGFKMARQHICGKHDAARRR